jgi:hypothetical protein
MKDGWNKIVKGDGKTGYYLVAFYDTLTGYVGVGIGSYIDAEWSVSPFTIPVAWMPLPDAPTLTELGIREPVDDDEEAKLRDALGAAR